jgi:hypothetical protein
MNANLTWDIGGAADAAPSSWLAFLGLFEHARTPTPKVSKGEIGQVKVDVLAYLVLNPNSTVKGVRASLEAKYSVARINAALSQLHSTGRATRSRRGPGGYYRYKARVES